MQDNPGIFIVLEGSDGSGKTTQFRLLSERLRAVGYEVEVFDFPRYDQPSSHFVKRYLNGDYGPASNVNPYTASMFYALDRYEAAADIRNALKAGKVVLSNRYAGSNMAHQGSKFDDETEQRGFFVWADSLEFSLLGIPRPNLNLFLRVPAQISYKLIARKDTREYTGKSHDEHEADINHLKRSVATYDLLCKLFPRDFLAIECSQNDKIMSIPEINNKIWEIVKPLLPATPTRKGHNVVVQLNPASKESAPQSTKTPDRFIGEQRVVSLPKVSMLALASLSVASGIKVQAEQPWLSNKNDFVYFSPTSINGELSNKYEDGMKKLAKAQKNMRRRLVQYLEQQNKTGLSAQDSVYSLLQPAIPLAAITSVKLTGNMAAFYSLADELAHSKLPELKSIARQLNEKLEIKDTPLAHNKAKLPIVPLNLASLPNNLSAELEPLKLIDYWPRSEFSLLADEFYAHTDLGREELLESLERWTYDDKENALRALVLDTNSHVLDHARYRFDVISDRSTLSNALSRGLIADLQTQASTPRYGYKVPEIIERAGLENDYIECFDTSFELFSEFQAANKETEAAYAVLLGHKLRWQFSTNTRSLLKSDSGRSTEQIPLIKDIVEKVSAVHPILGTTLLQTIKDKPTAPQISAHNKVKKSRHRSRKPRR